MLLRRTERRLKVSILLLALVSLSVTFLFNIVLPAVSEETQSVAPPAGDSTSGAVRKLDELYELMDRHLALPCADLVRELARPKYEELRRTLAALEEGEERK